MVKLVTFLKEVKVEAAKVVWPGRKDAAVAAALVMLVSTLCAIFFFLVDSVINKIIHFVLGIG